MITYVTNKDEIINLDHIYLIELWLKDQYGNNFVNKSALYDRIQS